MQPERPNVYTARNPAVEVHDLTVSYHEKPVLWGIDFTLPSGSLTGIIGPNGAGKSTLIKLIMGLIKPASGYVLIHGQPQAKMRKQISYVPQRESVDWDFPVTAREVVLMGRYPHLGLFRRPSKRDRQIAEACLEKVGMLDYGSRQIGQLSGGQQQRVFIARALAQQAEVYFMDEPFAGVDAATQNTIFQLLTEMKQEGKTVVVVHHDLQSVEAYFNWVVLLNLRLIASGPTEKVFANELLQETYGGRLTLLAKAGELMAQQRFPTREG